MLKKIIIGVFALIFGFLVLAAGQPEEYEISRKLPMNVSPMVVFEEVNDLHRWQNWSPWEKIDPDMKKSYTGASSGVGASYAWAGNGQVGEGRMTIIESHPGRLVRLKLEFLKPFKDTVNAELSFEPKGDETIVRWNMYGKRNFMGKAIGLVMNCDKIMGPQFEQGLADLKTVAESK
jgi:hypothetical protein